MSSPPVEPGRCRTCKARVWWARTAAGASSPYDADPTEEGSWLLVWRSEAGELCANYVKPEDRGELLAAGRNLYRTHFATCPQAEQHRKQPDRRPL